MSFSTFKDYISKVVTGGQSHSATFRKTSASATTAGVWCDVSTMPGHPVTNFYASTPLVGATLLAREGLQHGQNISPDQKYLKRITAMSAQAPLTLVMVDILKYYPFIDGDSTDEQLFDNAVTLPRYTDGAGVQAYVVSQGSFVGGAQFFMNYTNQNGVSGRISRLCTSNTTAVSGTLISSGVSAGTFGWAVPLADNDYGIRSVESFTFTSANGGIFALVLCKEIGSLGLREANVPAEKDYLLETGLSMPEIKDGAYLSFLALPSGSLAAQPFYGSIQTTWG